MFCGLSALSLLALAPMAELKVPTVPRRNERERQRMYVTPGIPDAEAAIPLAAFHELEHNFPSPKAPRV